MTDSISIIGCGYVGLLTGVILADKNRNKNFVLLDIDKNKIEKLKKKEFYLNENGFVQIFESLRNIKLTSDYSDISDSNIVIIAVNTPDDNGKCNLSYLYATIDHINKYAKENSIIVIKSTVEVGTTKQLCEDRFRKDLYVFNIPEFLAEGEAITNLLYPVRVLIGYTDKTKENYEFKLNELRSLFYYVDYDKIVVTDSNTSELIKLSSNFMLAQRVASINAIEHLAKEKNANILDISRTLRMDDRIGNKFLNPSAGFGGSCFRKDINNISNICSDRFYKEYFKNVNIINDYHMIEISEYLDKFSKVLFLGYGFKETTEDTRESPTQFVIDYLSKSVEYKVYDRNIEKYNDKSILKDEYDCIALMNNEEEYVTYVKEYSKLFPNTKIVNPKYISLD